MLSPKKLKHKEKEDLIDEAIKIGNIDFVKYLHSIDYTFSKKTTIIATQSGQLEILKWLCEKWAPRVYLRCCHAIHGEHLHIIEWLQNNGCPPDEYTFATATKYNKLNVIKWLHNNGYIWDYETTDNAIKYCNLEILRYAVENNCP